MYAQIVALILAIAPQYNLPPKFVLAIALIETGGTLNPYSKHYNKETDTWDLGVMQNNTSWYKDKNWTDPESNIRAGCAYIVRLVEHPDTTTWWSVALAYNAGIGRLMSPPTRSVMYACMVIDTWCELGDAREVVLPNYMVKRRAW